MHTRKLETSNIEHVQEYYKAGLRKDFTEMAKYLHPEVVFLAPLAKLNGREAVVEAAKGFFGFLQSIEFRAGFANDNQVMIAYNAIFPDPVGKFPTAIYVTFKDGLMSQMELFYDPRPLLA